MTHLYTHPKPPSPILRARLKFFVAVFSSNNVKILRSLGLGDKLENGLLPRDSVLVVAEMFWEFKSDPDILVSRSVRLEYEDGTDVDFVVLVSSFFSPM